MDTLIDAVALKRGQTITAATDVAQNAPARFWRRTGEKVSKNLTPEGESF
jgi:hypothetical protein